MDPSMPDRPDAAADAAPHRPDPDRPSVDRPDPDRPPVDRPGPDRPPPSGPPRDPLRPPAGASPLRRRTYQIVFGHETRAGRWFDIVLIVAILASVFVVMLESVVPIRADHGPLLRALEWSFTILFTVEYAVRLWCTGAPGRYARSFFGVIDLMAFLPTYISVLVPGGQVLTVVRILRVLRVFRILKLAQYVGEAELLARAMRASGRKITIFVFTVLTIVVIVGSLMYLIEGPEAGFTSIFRGVYWGVVTLTTVGFGDITPLTPLGQTLATAVMIMGYGIIAVPTGIVTVELAQAVRRDMATRTGGAGGPDGPSGPESIAIPEASGGTDPGCPRCGLTGHDGDARYCKRCGEGLGGSARG